MKHTSRARAHRAPIVASLAALLLAPLPALAADCLGLGPAGTPAKLHEVDSSNAPVFFIRNTSERPECPADTPACRTSSSLPSGSRVLVGEANGPWSCVAHADKTGVVSSGWLPSASLTPVPDSTTIRPADWAGRWRGGPGRSIRITANRDGSVTLRADPADSARPPRGTASGAVAAQFVPAGAEAAFVLGADGSIRADAPGEASLCRLALQRRGAYLVVQDNGRCGGGSLTGPYQRRR